MFGLDTVTHLQLEVEALKFGPLGHSTLSGPTWPVRSIPMVFMSTNVPMIAGVTSWEQYRQVFDAIAQSNGWDGPTAALQLHVVSPGGRCVECGPTELESLLFTGGSAGTEAPPPPNTGITDMETLLQRLLPGVPIADSRSPFVGMGLQWCVSPAASRGTEWAGVPN